MFIGHMSDFYMQCVFVVDHQRECAQIFRTRLSVVLRSQARHDLGTKDKVTLKWITMADVPNECACGVVPAVC